MPQDRLCSKCLEEMDEDGRRENDETGTLTTLSASHVARFTTAAGGRGCLGSGWGGRGGGRGRGSGRGGRSGSSIGRRGSRYRGGRGSRGCRRGSVRGWRRRERCDVDGWCRGGEGRGGVGGRGDTALVEGAFALWEREVVRVCADVDGAGDGAVGVAVDVAGDVRGREDGGGEGEGEDGEEGKEWGHGW